MRNIHGDSWRVVARSAAPRLLTFALVTACGGGITDTGPDAPQVAEVVVAPLTSNVTIGGSLPLQASVRDASGQVISGPTVVWSVQDTNIAVVSSLGVVTGREVGSTQVAASANGKSGLASVTVMPVPVATVSVSPARVDLAPGGHVSLAAVTAAASGTPLAGRAVIWATSNSGVATVDASGVITAVAPGSASITATSEGVSGTAIVSVAVPAVAGVTIQPRSATIQRGTTLQLSATITDVAGAAVTDRIPTWTSIHPDVAIVSVSGLVTAIAPGSASIVGTLDGKADTATVAVVPVPVGSVSVQPTTTNIGVGQSTTLTATVKDANGAVVTDRLVTWTSSNTLVATVTTGGVVRALAGGTATIAATSEGNTGSATVIVSAPIASIVLQPTAVTLQRNMTAILAPTLKDAAGNVLTGRAIAWQSSDSTVARVSGTGVVTAIKLGAATISATSEGKSASAAVTVVTGPVVQVVVTPGLVDNLRIGHTVQLAATALDANGDSIAGAVFTWSSSNSTIASVNSTGRVTGIRSGTVTISATFSGKTGNASVRVR